MTADVLQTASIAGELAENLYGRTDFAKYDGAWAKAHNWVVDYRGGLFTRAGFEFGDVIEWTAGEAVKFIEFQYSPDTANTYLCIFTNDKVRFAQDNAYVLEADIAVTALANSTGDDVQFTATGHGFSNGDWVKLSDFTTNTVLNGRTAEVTNKTTNTFELTCTITGEIIEIASVTTEAGVVNRIYTITSPYGEEELRELRATQVRDYVRLTHPDYPVKNLIRNDATDWEITNEAIGVSIDPPTNPSKINQSGNDADGHIWSITAVNEDGEESVPVRLVTTAGPNHVFQPNKFITIGWTAAADAVKYNVYRSTYYSNTTTFNSDGTTGYIGRSIGIEFTDSGITADNTKIPPINYNPFANGAIRYVTVDTAGSGYDYDDTISWPAGGSGAYGYLVTEGGGSEVKGVQIYDGGSGYTGTAVSASGGSSFSGTATLTPLTGNNPHCSAIFQQRMIYAATDNNPLRIYGSQAGLLSNFNYTELGTDEESFEFDLDSPKVAPIRHMMPVRGGLLCFSELGVWLVYGANEEILTGNNAKADLQNNTGCSLTQPVYIDSYVLYISQAGQEIRMLAYDDYNKVYGGRNVSLLSNHLFDSETTIDSLTYSPIPHKIVYAVQDTGRMIATTIDNENSVFACTPLWTKGYFRYCLNIEEDSESRLYVAVERSIGSNRVLFFERLTKRNDFKMIDDSFCLDAGLTLTKTYPAATLTPSSFTGTVTFTAGSAVFAGGDVGKIIRCGSGKAEITGYSSTTVVTGEWINDLVETLPEDEDTPFTFAAGDWTMDSEVSTVGGLWHLEGETVSVLADGVPVTDKTVSNGSLSLTTAASRIIVGLPYKCRAQTLPITVSDVSIEARRKDIVELGIRMYRTAGLKIGASLEKLYSVADRRQRLWPTTVNPSLRTEIVVEPLRTDWSRDNQIWFVQDQPLPAAILAIVRDTDVGDDKGNRDDSA